MSKKVLRNRKFLRLFFPPERKAQVTVFIIIGILMWFELYNILVQSCLIIGLSGIYTLKTKNFGSVKKSEEKEGIEHKRLNGINISYIITIIGIFFNLLLFSIYISFHIV